MKEIPEGFNGLTHVMLSGFSGGLLTTSLKRQMIKTSIYRGALHAPVTSNICESLSNEAHISMNYLCVLLYAIFLKFNRVRYANQYC